jgi:hypothetical protein
MNSNSNDSPPEAPEVVTLRSLPPEAQQVGSQPMRCDSCGAQYDLPLYEMPDGPIMTVARCPACGMHAKQVPVEVAG